MSRPTVEPAGDFDDLLQAYDMDMDQPLSDVVKASGMDDSEGKSHDSPPSGNDEMSWEVMQVGDPDPIPSTDIEYSTKNKTDSDDWILQPDTDKKSMKDTEDPPIENAPSLIGDETDQVQKEDVETSEHEESSKKKGREHFSGTEDEDSEALVIDTSLSAAESDSQKKDEPTPTKMNGTSNVQGDHEGTSHEQGDHEGTSNVQGDHEENENEKATEKDDSSDVSVDRTQSGAEYVPPETQTISNSSSPKADDEPLPPENSEEEEAENQQQSPTDDDKTATASDKPTMKSPSSGDKTPIDTPSVTEKIPEYGMIKNKKNETIIVIEPTSPNIEPMKWDQVNFIPGTVKLEPAVTKTSTPSKHTSENISVSASLTTGTSLSSALQTLPSVIPTVITNSSAPHIVQPPKTILRSPPGKPMPQFLFRHVGPGSRPSYVRLGSQALQQIARLTSPPGMPSVSNSQRMISVLMNPSATAASGTGLASTFPHIVTGKTPGTLVPGANPNSPLKVLIIPSQANTAVTSAKSVSTVSSTTPSQNITVVTPSSVMTPTPASNKKTPNKNGQSLTQNIKVPGGSRRGRKPNNNSENSKGKSAAFNNLDIGVNIALTEERFKRRMLGKVNFMKPYHPTLTGSMTSIGFGFYSCPGCRDVYVNKSSLDLHRTRKSIRIVFNCEICRSMLVFGNKCQFRCHMLKHVPELKNLSRHLLEAIDIQSLWSINSTKDGIAEEEKLDKAPDKTESVQMEEIKVKENLKIHEHEVETTSLADVPENEPTLGLTISSVSSISPDENIPVGETATTTSVNDLHPPPPPPADRNPVFMKGIAMEPTLLSQQPSQVTAINPQPILNVIYNSEALKGHVSSNVGPEKNAERPPQSVDTGNSVHSQAPVVYLGNSVQNEPTVVYPANSVNSQPTVVYPAKRILPNNVTLGHPATNSVQNQDAKLPKTTAFAASTPAPIAPKSDSGEVPETGNIFCTECHKTFASYMALQKHFNDSDKPHPLKAPCCGARLSSECSVHAHMRTHLDQRPYVCPDCGICFRGNVSIFRSHRNLCSEIVESAMIVYPCRKCPRWYLRIDELRTHIRENHSESYLKCNLCPMAFKTMGSFKDHNIVKHRIMTDEDANYSSIYKCPLCDSVFHEQRLKYEHMEHHINNIYATQKVSFMCNICKKLNPSYMSMRAHLREKHDCTSLGYICDHCGEEHDTINKFVDHLKKTHSRIPANMLVAPQSVLEMMASVGEKPEPAKITVTVAMPVPSPKEKKETKVPASSASSEGQSKEETATPSDTTSSRDTHSPGNLSRTSSMYSEGASDETTGAGGGSMKCHICLHVFANRKALIRHKKMDHGLMKTRRRRGDTAISAPQPEKKLKVEEDMKTPELQVKSDFMLRFQCDDCDYRTTSFLDLQHHRKETHGAQARFPCQLCGETFESSAKVDEHQKTTHAGSVREYPYNCWICNEKNIRKGYSKRAHLMKHLINAHKIPSRTVDTERLNKMDEAALAQESTKDEPSEATSAKVPRTASGTSFKCVRCAFHSESREVFTEHINGHKLASDSFLCHECGMCFTVMTALRNHLRLVHRIKNFDEYVEKNQIKLCSPPSANKAKRIVKERRNSGKKNGDPLECTVCYKKYTDEASLKNHMRSHGMAFIRSKRLAPIAFITD